MQPTKVDIDVEIAALRALKPVGEFKASTLKLIHLAVMELQEGFDTSAEEFNELPAAQREVIMDTNNWKSGFTRRKPSEGWGSLVKQ